MVELEIFVQKTDEVGGRRESWPQHLDPTLPFPLESFSFSINLQWMIRFSSLSYPLRALTNPMLRRDSGQTLSRWLRTTTNSPRVGSVIHNPH